MLATLVAILLGPPDVEQLASLQASNSLDRLAGAEIGDALPPGWRLRAVGDEATESRWSCCATRKTARDGGSRNAETRTRIFVGPSTATPTRFVRWG